MGVRPAPGPGLPTGERLLAGGAGVLVIPLVELLPKLATGPSTEQRPDAGCDKLPASPPELSANQAAGDRPTDGPDSFTSADILATSHDSSRQDQRCNCSHLDTSHISLQGFAHPLTRT